MSTQASRASTIAATLLPGFVGTTLPGWLARRLAEGLGGVCIFGPNIVSIAQLRELTDSIYAANPDAIVAIDEEGGDVTRLYYDSGSPYPGNAVLGRLNDPAFTESVGQQVGAQLQAAGCNLAFAPDVDINSNSNNPVIGVRSFGTEPEHVARHGMAWISGIQSTGVAASVKHFPGHGDTSTDSHLAVPVIDQDAAGLREREFVPFQRAVEAGTRVVMTSHILVPQVDPDHPATFSRVILHDILRKELGFDGLIVTDALDMKGASGTVGIPAAAAAALAAGCDLLCIGTENTDEQIGRIIERVDAAVEAGELDEQRLVEAAGRVHALARELGDERGTVTGLEEPAVDPQKLVGALDVQSASAQWPDRAVDGYRVVRIDTEANIAIGVAPWGPFAEAQRHPDAEHVTGFAAAECLSVSEREPLSAEFGPNDRVLVVGRDNHRHEFARHTIDRLRQTGSDVLVVDMGWPGDDRRYADVATFGASRAMGSTLLHYLTGSVRLPEGAE